MTELEKVITGLECCSVKQSCSECPWKGLDCNDRLHLAAIELLKEEDKELHLADLDMLVNMIALKAKAEGRFFSPYEVGLALVAHGQHDERFQWGETIKYSPSEVERILNEVINDASQNS